MKNVLTDVANTITEEGIKFDVGYKDLFGREKKRYFHVKPLVLGSLARISKLYLSINIEAFTAQSTAQDAFKIAKEHCFTVSEIVAIAVTNKKADPSKRLINFFYYNLTAQELLILLNIIIKQASVLNFILSIISMKNLNVLGSKETETKEKEVSQ